MDEEISLRDEIPEVVCREYRESLQLVDKSLCANFVILETLSVKIESYNRKMFRNRPTSDKIKQLDVETTIDEVKLNLRENVKKIVEKLEEIEGLHKKLIGNLVACDEYAKEVAEEEEKEVREAIMAREDDRATIKIAPSTVLKSEETIRNAKKGDENVEKIIDEKGEKDETEELLEEFRSGVIDFDTLSIKASFDRVTITKEAVSAADSDVPPLNPCSLPPDIQRKRALEDLHAKLVRQVEASDSLEGFIKLMDRKPDDDTRNDHEKKLRTTKDTREGLQKKYNGSLWFFPRKQKMANERLKRSPRAAASQKSAKIKRSTTSSITTDAKERAKRETVSACTCNLLTGGSSMLQWGDEDKRSKRNVATTKLKYYDLLDDLAVKDLVPIKSEYPRRDNISKNVQSQPTDDDVTSYLHRFMKESDKVWKQLLLSPVKIQKRIKNKNVKNLMRYLTEPQQNNIGNNQRNVVVMPVKVYYDNFPTKEPSNFKAECALTMADLKDKMQSYDATKQIFMTDLTKMQNCGGKLPVIVENQEKFQKIVGEPSRRSTAPPLNRKRVMLEHLRGLKARNDTIQKNIQKAIDVIETKMIDILSSPNQSSSRTDAFNVMEQEITKVLKIMKEEEKKVDDIEVIQPEKDDNQISTTASGGDVQKPSASRRGILDFIPGVDLETKTTTPSDKIDAKNTVEESTKQVTKATTPSIEAGDAKNTIEKSTKQVKTGDEKDTRKLLGCEKKKTEKKKKSEEKLGDRKKNKDEEKLLGVVELDGEFGEKKKFDEGERIEETKKTEKVKKIELTNIGAQLGLKKLKEKCPPKGVGEGKKIEEKPTIPRRDRSEEKKKIVVAPNEKSPRSRSLVGKVEKKIELKEIKLPPKPTIEPANIEESEKLLDQVDNVIEKIDSIYTKFYDPSKSGGEEVDAKDGRSFNNVMEFLDNLQEMGEESPLIVNYTKIVGVATKFELTNCFALTVLYYPVDLTEIPRCSGEEKVTGDVGAYETSKSAMGDVGETWDEKRREMVLTAFYTIFFTAVFTALHLDYTS